MSYYRDEHYNPDEMRLNDAIDDAIAAALGGGGGGGGSAPVTWSDPYVDPTSGQYVQRSSTGIIHVLAQPQTAPGQPKAQLVQGGDGAWYWVDPMNPGAAPIPAGIPTKTATPSGPPQVIKGADGNSYIWDEPTQSYKLAPGLPSASGAQGMYSGGSVGDSTLQRTLADLAKASAKEQSDIARQQLALQQKAQAASERAQAEQLAISKAAQRGTLASQLGQLVGSTDPLGYSTALDAMGGGATPFTNRIAEGGNFITDAANTPGALTLQALDELNGRGTSGTAATGTTNGPPHTQGGTSTRGNSSGGLAGAFGRGFGFGGGNTQSGAPVVAPAPPGEVVTGTPDGGAQFGGTPAPGSLPPGDVGGTNPGWHGGQGESLARPRGNGGIDHLVHSPNGDGTLIPASEARRLLAIYAQGLPNPQTGSVVSGAPAGTTVASGFTATGQPTYNNPNLTTVEFVDKVPGADQTVVGPVTRAAQGGLTSAHQMLVGDAQHPNPWANGARPEIVQNPTGAPISVIPAPQTQSMLGGPSGPITTMPISYHAGGGGNAWPGMGGLRGAFFGGRTMPQALSGQQYRQQFHPRPQPLQMPRFAFGTQTWRPSAGSRTLPSFTRPVRTGGPPAAPAAPGLGGLTGIVPQQSYLDRIAAYRAATQGPTLNLYDVGYSQLDPTYRDVGLGVLKDKYGVPIASSQALQQKYAIGGIDAYQAARGY